MQTTLKESVKCRGIGLHSGEMVRMTLRPADEDTGIVFFRSDVQEDKGVVAARWNRVVDTQLCTMIGNESGTTIGTVEHLMAALRGLEVDNVIVELDGPEVPVMDGSSKEFVRLILQAGIKEQSKPREYIKVLEEIIVSDGDKVAKLSPYGGSVFAARIEFEHEAIGAQNFELNLAKGAFAKDLADCRTFGFFNEVEYLRSIGLAKGGSLANAVVLNDEGIMNTEGLRRKDEFVRHKLLDSVGDLYMAGYQILGRYEGFKAGHAMNNKLLHQMFSGRKCYELVRGDSLALVGHLNANQGTYQQERIAN